MISTVLSFNTVSYENFNKITKRIIYVKEKQVSNDLGNNKYSRMTFWIFFCVFWIKFRRKRYILLSRVFKLSF